MTRWGLHVGKLGASGRWAVRRRKLGGSGGRFAVKHWEGGTLSKAGLARPGSELYGFRKWDKNSVK